VVEVGESAFGLAVNIPEDLGIDWDKKNRLVFTSRF
jgi:hypothetical protein